MTKQAQGPRPVTRHSAAEPVQGFACKTPHRAIELAIADHQAYAKSCVDWDFVGLLRDAQALLKEFADLPMSCETPGVARDDSLDDLIGKARKAVRS